MALVIQDRIKDTTTTTGTGQLTLANSPPAGFQAFSVVGNSNTTKYCLLDANGTAWEVGIGTYVSSGTKLSRTTVLASSNSGSAITLTSGTHTVFCDWLGADGQSFDNVAQTYIAGGLVRKHSGANTIDITAGACYDPLTSKVISWAAQSGLSAGSLGASQKNQVYVKDVSGTATFAVVNNANPPSTMYAGTARYDATNGRWLGELKTTSGSALIDEMVSEEGGALIYTPFALTNAGIWRLLTASSVGTWTNIDLTGVIPKYASREFFGCMTTNASSGVSTAAIYFALDAALAGGSTANRNATLGGYCDTNFTEFGGWVPIIADTTNVYYRASASGSNGGVYLDVQAYKVAR